MGHVDEINFLCDSFCKYFHIKNRILTELAEMANGEDHILQETVHAVSVQIMAYTEPLYFAISPLKSYGAIILKYLCAYHVTKSN